MFYQNLETVLVMSKTPLFRMASINGSTIANNVAFTIVELCAIRDNLYFQNLE